MRSEYTRRRVVQAGLGCLPLAIAGCGSSGRETTDGLAGSDAFVETDIDGSALVVQLRDDAELTRVTLLDPDGAEFESASVAAGATSVRLPLFDIRSGRHYTPGEHTLVGVADGAEQTSVSLELRPELEITDVEPYTGGEDVPRNRGNLLVTVENVGTGPTWVYFLSYSDAPSDPANSTPPDESIIRGAEDNFREPSSEQDTILSPGDSTGFLGRHPPILLSNERECNDESISLEATIRSGIGPHRQQEIEASLSGDKIKQSFQTSCSEIDVTLVGDTENVEQ